MSNDFTLVVKMKNGDEHALIPGDIIVTGDQHTQLSLEPEFEDCFAIRLKNNGLPEFRNWRDSAQYSQFAEALIANVPEGYAIYEEDGNGVRWSEGRSEAQLLGGSTPRPVRRVYVDDSDEFYTLDGGAGFCWIIGPAKQIDTLHEQIDPKIAAAIAEFAQFDDTDGSTTYTLLDKMLDLLRHEDTDSIPDNEPSKQYPQTLGRNSKQYPRIYKGTEHRETEGVQLHGALRVNSGHVDAQRYDPIYNTLQRAGSRGGSAKSLRLALRLVYRFVTQILVDTPAKDPQGKKVFFNLMQRHETSNETTDPRTGAKAPGLQPGQGRDPWYSHQFLWGVIFAGALWPFKSIREVVGRLKDKLIAEPVRGSRLHGSRASAWYVRAIRAIVLTDEDRKKAAMESGAVGIDTMLDSVKAGESYFVHDANKQTTFVFDVWQACAFLYESLMLVQLGAKIKAESSKTLHRIGVYILDNCLVLTDTGMLWLAYVHDPKTGANKLGSVGLNGYGVAFFGLLGRILPESDLRDRCRLAACQLADTVYNFLGYTGNSYAWPETDHVMPMDPEDLTIKASFGVAGFKAVAQPLYGALPGVLKDIREWQQEFLDRGLYEIPRGAGVEPTGTTEPDPQGPGTTEPEPTDPVDPIVDPVEPEPVEPKPTEPVSRDVLEAQVSSLRAELKDSAYILRDQADRFEALAREP